MWFTKIIICLVSKLIYLPRLSQLYAEMLQQEIYQN